ncbi:MAG: ATP-binding protein, partial [Planctomycetota bacterium]
GVRRDGREVIVEVALTRLQLDGDDLILASVVDVSARVEARNRLRWAVDVGQVGFWELDFVAATGASETLLLQQLGMDQPWTNISEFLAEVHPDDVEPLRESFTKFLASDDTLHEAIFRSRTAAAGGEDRWTLSRGTKVANSQGQLQRIVGFHFDITELQLVRVDLERSNDDLDRFAYIASHDLKAPLRGILHLTNWIREDLSDGISDGVDEHLVMLQDQAERMTRLLDDILAYARVGKQRVAPEKVDLSETASELFQFLSPPDTVRLELGNNLPVLVTARAALEQVLRNLISNAIDHAPVAGKPLTIRVSCESFDGYCEISVDDDGRGIEAEYQRDVFEVFRSFCEEPSVGSTGRRTGMGLAIVKRVLDEIGCHIVLESKPGHGSRFRFTWPIQP